MTKRCALGTVGERATMAFLPIRDASMRASRSRMVEPGEDDRVLELGVLDGHVLGDRGVGADVGVADHGAGADHGRSADGGALEGGAGLDHDAALDLAVGDLAVQALDHGVQDQPVGLEHVRDLAGVLPPALDHVGVHALAGVDQVLDRVGDLQLAAGRGLDRLGGVEDAGGEHVHAHQRQIGRGLGRLLDEPGHAPVAGQLGHAVVLGVGHLGQQDQRVRARRPRTCAPGR